jgi:hypothetical protein
MLLRLLYAIQPLHNLLIAEYSQRPGSDHQSSNHIRHPVAHDFDVDEVVIAGNSLRRTWMLVRED